MIKMYEHIFNDYGDFSIKVEENNKNNPINWIKLTEENYFNYPHNKLLYTIDNDGKYFIEIRGTFKDTLNACNYLNNEAQKYLQEEPDEAWRMIPYDNDNGRSDFITIYSNCPDDINKAFELLKAIISSLAELED